MKNKLATLEEVLSHIEDGQTIVFGDWHGEISADEVIEGMIEKGVKDIDAIAVSSGMKDQGIGKLIVNHQIKSIATTHIGLNPVAQEQYVAGELDVEFVPQGTYAERIRAGGYGLGGVLTPTGVGTDVAEGKEVLNIDGKDYLLEKPLRGDVALIRAWRGDKLGNIQFRMVGRATNSYSAYAGDYVICEVEELVEPGVLKPDDIDVPAPVIDAIYVRQGEKKPFCPMWKKLQKKSEAKAAEKKAAAEAAKEARIAELEAKLAALEAKVAELTGAEEEA